MNKAQLIEAIEEASNKLEKTVATDDLNNTELKAILDELNQEIEDNDDLSEENQTAPRVATSRQQYSREELEARGIDPKPYGYSTKK